jgi:hypothetical protein
MRCVGLDLDPLSTGRCSVVRNEEATGRKSRVAGDQYIGTNVRMFV